jgi:hypothetical protein
MGRSAWLWLGLAALAGRAVAERELTSETLLLARIKVKMSENLSRLPNYTCLETIERSRRRAPSRRFRLVDTLRLEVALVGGKELFSWPGASAFEEKELRDMVGGGAIGNGNFGLHARSVFLSSSPTYTYIGEVSRDGRSSIRYDYQVPQMRSGYRIRVGSKEAIVGYHGSFWVDAKSLDLLRLEVHADDIPPYLEISSAGDEMEYKRVAIGEGNFLLPRSSVLTMTDVRGNVSRNHTLFTECRQYTGESFLSFGDPPPEVPRATPEPVTEVELPQGLVIELHLTTPVDGEQSAVGDPISAVVAANAKKKGKVIIPKGAVATGRLVRLEKRPGDFDYYVVGVRFSTIEFGNHRAAFLARLEDAGSPVQIGGRVSMSLVPGRRVIFQEPAAEQWTNVGVFYVRASRLRLTRGLRMIWRTESTTGGEKQ